MLIRDLKTATYFETTDGTFICELLHPHREEKDIKINFSIAHAILGPEESSHPHRIKSAGEIYFILEGKGLMHIDNQQALLEPGQLVYIPPGSMQFIKNVSSSELKFLCMVSPPWRKEDDEICLE
ncbi:cupin domain-containing protein [Methanobacterium alkalithermotolerans]|uniref:Cupin domain-containing protein n=1 Tax=Methanobacterium alkalithermotolerans TaxID=2731220 RepID=A0A8T8K8F1_9EURY|nr:cupin domain-containing protein [Methanobacterium alkalithermotolerans]